MNYEVRLTGTARRQLRSLPSDVIRRVDDVLKSLESDPRPSGVVRLRGSTLVGWRVRVGNYRILFAIDDESQQISVYRIAHRRESYR